MKNQVDKEVQLSEVPKTWYYSTHDKPPNAYSNNRPRIRIIKNENSITETKSEGTRKATSTSKTIKIIASKKNFMQNGRELVEIGSKPHS